MDKRLLNPVDYSLFLKDHLAEYFEARIKLDNQCWIWTGSIHTATGYGIIYLDYKNYKAHRASLVHYSKTWEPHLMALHLCHNPTCINPFHLYWGDNWDNMEDMQNANRGYWSNKTHCKNGHELSGNNVAWDIRTGTNQKRRRCLACKRASKKRHYERTKHLRSWTKFNKRKSEERRRLRMLKESGDSI